MGRHSHVTPHLARYARHPLPTGEGYVSDFCPLCPAQDTGKGQAKPDVVLSEQRFGLAFGAQLAECYIEPWGEITLCTF
jgi:hypothetical protein